MAIDELKAHCLPNPSRRRDVEIRPGSRRKEKHHPRAQSPVQAINDEIRKAGGWVTSVPGDRYVDFEVLPAIPAQIRFQVEPNGYGEGILPHSVVEYFTKNADGTLSLLTEGSTQPVSSRVTHAGIARVAKFFFLID